MQRCYRYQIIISLIFLQTAIVRIFSLKSHELRYNTAIAASFLITNYCYVYSNVFVGYRSNFAFFRQNLVCIHFISTYHFKVIVFSLYVLKMHRLCFFIFHKIFLIFTDTDFELLLGFCC